MKFIKLANLSILYSILLNINGFSQIKCGSELNLSYIQNNNPERYNRIIALEQFTQNVINTISNDDSTSRLIVPSATIIIPVVVHVLHRGELPGVGRNISDVQIQSQIDVLNEDFRRLNSDRINTPVAFMPVASDPNFEFRLACMDPNGNVSNGITRSFAGLSQFQPLNYINADGSFNEQATGIKYTANGGIDAWQTNRYLNIWVCDMGGGLIGYGQFPDEFSVKPNTDGIVMQYNAFGRIGNLQVGLEQGRVCVHEIGHWLNLRHIWGDANCGDDLVNDTPQQETKNHNCPLYPHFSNCTNNGSNGDMFMNYMDYTNNGCMNLFTTGQSLRMRAVFAQGGPRAAFINNYFRIEPPPTSICNTGIIVAKNLTCLPVMWSIISGPATILSGQGTNSVNLQRSGNGNVILRATAGGVYFDEITINVGTPHIGDNNPLYKIWMGNSNTDYNNVCNYQTTYTNMPISGATSVVWTRVAATPTNTNWSQNGTYLSFYFWAVGQTAVFKISASNACGLVDQKLGFKSISCGGGGGCRQYTVSPNPAKGFLNIIVPNIPPPCDYKMSATNSKMQSPVITQVNIFDNAGNLKYSQKANKAKAININLQGFKNGIYYVEIKDSKYSERQKIVIEE